jgi:hypothetical protein
MMVKVKCKDGEVQITKWQAGLLFTGQYSEYSFDGTKHDLALEILRAQDTYNSIRN